MKYLTILLSAIVASTSASLGINCRGSGLCVGNHGLLGEALGQLRGMDQGQTFTDGQHVTCVESSITIGSPSLCIFYQKTNGRKWTVGQTVQHVQNLLNHGCTACGSDPTDPGNNVKHGELTANMVTNAKRREIDQESAAAPIMPDVTMNPDEHELTRRSLGINCRGSSTCMVGGIGHSPAGTLSQVYAAVAAGPEGRWSNGQHVGCVPHVVGRLCAFYQNIGSRTFDREQTLGYLSQLTDHHCRVCGSVPTDPGNKVKNGQLTVNYVS